MAGYSSDSDHNSPDAIPFEKGDIRNPTLVINLVFSSKDQAKEAVTWYALQSKKPVRFILNDRRRLKLVCKYPCKWHCLISPSRSLGPTDFKIKKLAARHSNCPIERQGTHGRPKKSRNRSTKEVQQRGGIRTARRRPQEGVASVARHCTLRVLVHSLCQRQLREITMNHDEGEEVVVEEVPEGELEEEVEGAHQQVLLKKKQGVPPSNAQGSQRNNTIWRN